MNKFAIVFLSSAISLVFSAGCAKPVTGVPVAESPDGPVELLVRKDGLIVHEAGTFLEAVNRKDDVPVVVDFWAAWCGPCRMLAPELEKVKSEWGEKVSIVKVDVDANSAISQHFEISAIPRLMVFRSGRSVANITGYTSAAQLSERLNQMQ